MEAGDKKRGRKRKEEEGSEGSKGRRQSDRHRDIKRVEKTRKKEGRGGRLWVPGLSGM